MNRYQVVPAKTQKEAIEKSQWQVGDILQVVGHEASAAGKIDGHVSYSVWPVLAKVQHMEDDQCKSQSTTETISD